MESVIFDLYGTLVQFGVQHHPYRRVMQWAREQGRRPKPDDARTLMTIDDSPQMVFSKMGIKLPAALLSRFNRELQEELESMVLFDDVGPILAALKSEGICVAVCSNLAQPYGCVIVGDNLVADVEGPTRIGMHALYLQRDKVTSGNVINSLSQVAMAAGRFFQGYRFAARQNPPEPIEFISD